MFSFFKRNKKTNLKTEFKGIIGEYTENEKPVIVRFVNEIPDNQIITKLPWFTVISWEYKDDNRNGMPSLSTNNRMISLENVLLSTFESKDDCKHAYNRTGNNLKEYNYYIANRNEFIKQLNLALTDHDEYPIEITFYEDLEWKEMKTIISDFIK